MAQFPSIVRQLRSMVSPSGSTGVTDAELLDRFVTMRDEPAFEVLIWRHGPMVLGLCRRLLGQEQDCEDAFQATFLALARKAGSIARREAVASWLYKVAYRIALDARMQRARITNHEIGVAACPDTPGPDDVAGAVAGQELKSLLDGAIQRLARKYREPVVLCYLEGKTQEEAAAELGWAKGTVSTRLIRARQLLRRRLEGLVETPAFSGMLPALASSPVPRAWVQESLRMALGFRARSAAAQAASTKAMMLAEGVLHAMTLSRWKIAAMLVVLLSLGSGAGWLGYQATFAAAPAEEMAPELVAVPGDQAAERRASSTLNQLDPQRIPPEDRFPWQPPELVAVLGEHRGHAWGEVTCAAFSPDGRWIASGGRDSAIRLWDPATLYERAVLKEHTQGVHCLAFSPDGKTLASAASDGKLVLWDLAASPPRSRVVVSCPPWVYGLAFSPDGALLARTGDRGEVAVFSVAGSKAPEPSCVLQGMKEFFHCLAFSPDGKTLFVGTQKGSLLIWDLSTKTLKATVKSEATTLRSISLSPDGKTLACCGEDRPGQPVNVGADRPGNPPQQPRYLVILWDITDRAHPKQRALLNKHSSQVLTVKFSPDGKTLASGSTDATIRLWDVAGPAPAERAVIKARGWNTALDFSTDGKTLLTGGRDSVLRLWDLTAADAKERFEPKGHTDSRIHGLALARTGVLASEASDGVWLWDLSGAQPNAGNRVLPWGSPVLSRDGKTLALGLGGVIEFWDLDAKQPRKRWRRQAHRLGNVAGGGSMAMSPDGKMLFSSGVDNKVLAWDLTTAEPHEKTVLEADAPSCAYHISASGALLSVATYGQSYVGSRNPNIHEDSATIRIWDMAGPKPRQTGMLVHRPDVLGAAFSPDGKILATAAGSRVANREVQPGELRLWRPGIPGRNEPYAIIDTQAALNSLVFSPDGQTLATVGWKGQVTLWEPATGKKYREWQLPGSVNNIVFSEDGRHLITANTNGTIYVLRLGQGVQAAVDPKPLWETLASDDGAAVYQAIWSLTAAAPQTLTLLRDKLHPVPPLAADQVEQWIKQLDDSRFSERQKATKALEQLRERAEPALLRTLAEGHPSLEARQRIEDILQKIPQPGPEQMRTLRAIQVLEHSSTSEARRLLKELAQGAAEAVETQYAGAAVERMEDSR